MNRIILIFIFIAALSGSGVAFAANTTTETQFFQFVYPASAESVVAPVVATADDVYDSMARRYGLVALAGSGRIEVIIARDEDAFFRAQPARGGVDPWVAGTAYPALDLIILSLEPDHFFRLPEIFRHEVSHITLFRAFGRQHPPRWFDEGLAIVMAGEGVAQRFQTAAAAAMTEGLIPFDQLLTQFPNPAPQAQLAYAQSAVFIQFLRQQHFLDVRLPTLTGSIRAGVPFEQAFAFQFGAPILELEQVFMHSLQGTWSWFTVLTGASVVWAALAVLFLMVYMRKKRRIASARKSLGQVDEDEELWPPTPLRVHRRDVILDKSGDG
ncbi:MAG: hypothetical protein HUU55_17495 [Myxococcales bacterium]|nr:hypothetical protein [Myxococcales bacterium]